jgi:hypothetical protein
MLGATLTLLLSSAAAATPVTPAERELAAPFQRWMHAVLAVPNAAAAPDLDASLRDAVGALMTQHLARLETLLPTWIAEAREHSGPQATREDLNRQTNNRLVNELALWRLESPGAAYDAVFLQAVLEPGVCNMP